MTRQLPGVRAVADKARDAITRLRPGAAESHRSLPIRRPAEEIVRLWSDDDARGAVLAGLPVADAALDVGSETPGWGTTVSVRLRLEAPVPGVAAQALAGKVLRRLKALAETGEIATTEHNPSYRSDAGEATA